MRKFFAPEVVQTSNMDCGPASLKCLLEGFGTHISYGRLREACQTSLDGTSIDTMESVANQLGLEAEQIMLPADHLLLDEAKALPAIIVVKLPNGLTHFVVVWRRHGGAVQIMDPAMGRRWTSRTDFLHELYLHTMTVPAVAWHEFAASEEFQLALRARLVGLRISQREAERLAAQALAENNWRALAGLDASVRLAASLAHTGGVRTSADAVRLVGRLSKNPELIPARYWSVRSAESSEGEEQLHMRGAVLVRIRGKQEAENALSVELQTALGEKPVSPARELLKLVRQSGGLTPLVLLFALLAGAGALVVEALLFRGLFNVGRDLAFASQRLEAISAVLVFGLALLLLELPAFNGAARLGRQIENRLRIAVLEKIPKLGDRYFRSRLISDMAERSHTMHRLRHVPELTRQVLRSFFELLATALAILWIEPSSAPFVLAVVAAALFPALLAQPILAERDLRVRSHAAGLTRFYLDAMLGLLSIRAHSAEGSMRKEHEKLLRQWNQAALRVQKTVVSVESVQMIAIFGLIAALVLFHPFHGANIARALLIVYWVLNLPSLGQEIAAVSRQLPYYRNLALRVFEPLGASEEISLSSEDVAALQKAPAIEFKDVTVEMAGHTILENINAQIASGSHVAIVGRSGAGKSSFVGVLLGWLKASSGEVLLDGVPLNSDALRRSAAWVDPAVQLWNRSLLANLVYGSEADAAAASQIIDAALLRGVLESLPDGLETKLGEGGALVSGGEGQRVRLGRAMLRQNVQLVILDEPFRGLDREKRRELLARAREFWRGATLLCITHDVSETQGFDQVLVVEQGHIAEAGHPEQLRSLPQSRYAQLIEAEEQTRSGLWSAGFWRRIRVHSGRIMEEHKPVDGKRPQTEVA